MDLFELVGKIAIENSDAKQALDDTSQAGEKTQGRLSKTFSAIGRGALAVGKTIGLGLAAGAGAMATLTVKALNLSGELEQNMGGSEAVFGKYADKMQQTAKTAFSSMGLSTSDFLATANKMGSLFQGAGFSIEESASLSTSAMQRAADVASIMGIDTASAMEAIAGAAKGNFTMMDNLGVAMNDTAIQNYALSKGINKSTAEMTQQEKIGLAMEMFMDKTAYAAGNYAKENETLAGSLGTAKAALTNFLDGSGTVDDLVSSFTNAANVIVGSLTEILPRLTTGLTEVVQGIIPLLPPLIQQLLPAVIEGATGLINGIVTVLPDVLTALLDAIPAIIDAFVQIMNAVIQALPQLMESLVAALPTLIPQLVNGLVSMIVMLCTMLPQIIQPIIDYLPDILILLMDALMNNLPVVIQGIGQLIAGLVAVLPQLLQAVWKVTVHAFQKLPEWFKNIFNSIKTAISNIWTSIKNSMSNIFNSIKNVATNVWNKVKDAITKPIETARDKIKGIIDKIKGFFSGMKLSFPKIKLPHFSIKPAGWKIKDLLEGEIPKLGIEWYAKGAIMKQPTLFDYNPVTGAARVGGEAGDEAIAPIDTLQGFIRSAVQAENAPMAAALDRIIDLLAQFFPQMLATAGTDIRLDDGTLVGRLAPRIDAELGRIKRGKDRGR